jgi:hypothetical protein
MAGQGGAPFLLSQVGAAFPYGRGATEARRGSDQRLAPRRGGAGLRVSRLGQPWNGILTGKDLGKQRCRVRVPPLAIHRTRLAPRPTLVGYPGEYDPLLGLIFFLRCLPDSTRAYILASI